MFARYIKAQHIQLTGNRHSMLSLCSANAVVVVHRSERLVWKLRERERKRERERENSVIRYVVKWSCKMQILCRSGSVVVTYCDIYTTLRKCTDSTAFHYRFPLVFQSILVSFSFSQFLFSFFFFSFVMCFICICMKQPEANQCYWKSKIHFIYCELHFNSLRTRPFLSHTLILTQWKIEISTNFPFIIWTILKSVNSMWNHMFARCCVDFYTSEWKQSFAIVHGFNINWK